MGSESKTLPETLAALFAPAEPSPLPDRLTPKCCARRSPACWSELGGRWR
jgi:hypothetical protein